MSRWSEAESNIELQLRLGFFEERWTGNAPFVLYEPIRALKFQHEVQGRRFLVPSRWTNDVASAAFATRRKMVIVGFLSNGSP